MNNYKIFFHLDDSRRTPLYLSTIGDDMCCDWCFESEDSLSFDKEPQALLNILQEKYPEVTLQITYFF